MQLSNEYIIIKKTFENLKQNGLYNHMHFNEKVVGKKRWKGIQKYIVCNNFTEYLGNHSFK